MSGDAALDHLAVSSSREGAAIFSPATLELAGVWSVNALIGPKTPMLTLESANYNRAVSVAASDKVRAAKLFRIRGRRPPGPGGLSASVIDHFNRLSCHRDLDVPGFLRAAAGMFSLDGTTAITLHDGLSRAIARIAPSMRRRRTCSYFIFSISLAGLIEIPPYQM